MTQLTHGRAAGDVPAALLRQDHIEDTGIAAGTSVMTMDGAIPVEFLSPGDRVITRSGLRILRAVEVRTMSGTAVRVGPDVLGVGRPECAVTLAAGQKLRISDWRAPTIFGTPVAYVPADRLVDGEHVARTAARKLRLFTLRFDAEEVIYAGGLELVSGAAVTVEA